MERDVTELQHKAGHQSADDPFEFIMSTEAEDRMGDVIVQSGWSLKEFRKNPIALFQHNHNMPIGSWREVRVVKDGGGAQLRGKLAMAEKGTSKLVDEVRSLLEQRVLRAVSVGFRSTKAELMDDDDPWGGIRFLKQTLLETSVVSVPANQEALLATKSCADLQLKDFKDIETQMVRDGMSEVDAILAVKAAKKDPVLATTYARAYLGAR